MKAELAKKEPPPGLHVILGDSAGGSFVQAFGARDRLLVDQDVLSCGPTPKCESFEAWRAMRLGYWNSLLDDDGGPYEDHRHNVLRNLPRLREAERVNLWFATSLSEQLSVAFSLHVLEALGADLQRVYLVEFDAQPGRGDPVRAMGQLNPEQIADHPEPVPLSAEALDDYRAAWAVMTSEEPLGFERFADARPNANEWLKRSMQLMLRRFPDKHRGMIHWDRVLLGYASDRPRKCSRIIGDTIGHNWDDGDFVGDYWLFARLLKMGDERLPKPLLNLVGMRSDMGSTEATLTPFGKDVLEGTASNYPANPIEEWAAGVKLSSSAGALWFKDGERLVNPQ